MRIAKALQINKGITSIIGGGGKTTLMLKLASELSSVGTVIICTTTRIYPPEDICVVNDSEIDVSKELKNNKVLCVSGGNSNGKLLPPKTSISEIAKLADYVICEADGAKRLPLKAHATYEPVIPEESDQVILVMGIDGIGKPINEVCHRSEFYSRLAGVKQDEIVTPEIAAAVINKEKFGTKVLINKVESDEQLKEAEIISEHLSLPVVIGSLKNGEYIC